MIWNSHNDHLFRFNSLHEERKLDTLEFVPDQGWLRLFIVGVMRRLTRF